MITELLDEKTSTFHRHLVWVNNYLKEGKSYSLENYDRIALFYFMATLNKSHPTRSLEALAKNFHFGMNIYQNLSWGLYNKGKLFKLLEEPYVPVNLVLKLKSNGAELDYPENEEQILINDLNYELKVIGGIDPEMLKCLGLSPGQKKVEKIMVDLTLVKLLIDLNINYIEQIKKYDNLLSLMKLEKELLMSDKIDVEFVNKNLGRK